MGSNELCGGVVIVDGRVSSCTRPKYHKETLCRVVVGAATGEHGVECFSDGTRRAFNNDSKPETIDHPTHYGGDTVYEAIKVIEAWGLNFCLGNAVKYICRAGKKGATLEDLLKARWYLDREIEKCR